MVKCHVHARQQQAPATEFLQEKPVVNAFAVRGIADDRMTDVLHVAAELMMASGERMQFDQCIA